MSESIPAGGVLLLQEDSLTDRPIHTERVTQLTGYADAKNAASCV